MSSLGDYRQPRRRTRGGTDCGGMPRWAGWATGESPYTGFGSGFPAQKRISPKRFRCLERSADEVPHTRMAVAPILVTQGRMLEAERQLSQFSRRRSGPATPKGGRAVAGRPTVPHHCWSRATLIGEVDLTAYSKHPHRRLLPKAAQLLIRAMVRSWTGEKRTRRYPAPA